MKRLSLLLLLVLCGGFASLAEAAAAAKDSADNKGQAIGRTDVIGSKEAPAVYNVVPWKDKSVPPPKKDIGSSILQKIQDPLDQDELRREIMLQESLGSQ
jgi:hypothetical protein